jgi:integrase
MPAKAKAMNEAVENLKLVLTSPRERAKGTLTSYLQTAKSFLDFLGDGVPPSDKDFRRYFLHRRDQGITERTLRKEFVQLKKLAEANSWPWPFTSDDTPVPEEEPFAPAFTPEEIRTLIEAQDKYSKGERFYLAVSTTWGLRREEMLRIRKRDYNETTIKIKTAKRGRRVEHLIPDEIKPILQAYHPKLRGINTLSYIFYRILDKAGLPRRKGYGWHSIRRTVETALEWGLAENRLPLSLVADFMGWSKTRKGAMYGGAPMVGVYSHPEVMADDPLAIDKLVLNVHPFVKMWRP